MINNTFKERAKKIKELSAALYDKTKNAKTISDKFMIIVYGTKLLNRILYIYEISKDLSNKIKLKWNKEMKDLLSENDKLDKNIEILYVKFRSLVAEFDEEANKWLQYYFNKE